MNGSRSNAAVRLAKHAALAIQDDLSAAAAIRIPNSYTTETVGALEPKPWQRPASQKGLPRLSLDLDFLDGLPELCEPLRKGINGYAARSGKHSTRSFVAALKLGLCAFFRARCSHANLSQIDESLLTAYVSWQQGPAASRNGSPLRASTSWRRILCARIVLEELRYFPKWAHDATLALEAFPSKFCLGANKTYRPVDVLSADTLMAIHRAALSEIGEITSRFAEGERLIEEGKRSLRNGKVPVSLSEQLAAMVTLYPEVFPELRELYKMNRPLWLAISGSRKYHPESAGLKRLISFRYARPRDLVAFILALAIEGAFNPITLFSLRRGDVRMRERLGVTVTSIEGKKKRAAHGVYAKDLDTKLVQPWFEVLAQITEPLRGALPRYERDLVFVFSPLQSKTVAKGFNQASEISSDVSWTRAFAGFRERHHIEQFALSQLRPTLLDLVSQRHGALVAQRIGRHKNFATTADHYLGSGAWDRERERLAGPLQQFERWVGSRGKIDTRRVVRKPNDDKGAATPGFRCADPFNSPLPGERAGRLCRAFGRCPACPLVQADLEDPLAIAYWVELAKQVEKAREFVDSFRWLKVWAPVANALSSLLGAVSQSALEQSSLFHVRLPPID